MSDQGMHVFNMRHKTHAFSTTGAKSRFFSRMCTCNRSIKSVYKMIVESAINAMKHNTRVATQNKKNIYYIKLVCCVETCQNANRECKTTCFWASSSAFFAWSINRGWNAAWYAFHGFHNCGIPSTGCADTTTWKWAAEGVLKSKNTPISETYMGYVDATLVHNHRLSNAQSIVPCGACARKVKAWVAIAHFQNIHVCFHVSSGWWCGMNADNMMQSMPWILKALVLGSNIYAQSVRSAQEQQMHAD